MADSMDLVQQRVEENLAHALANTLKRPAAPSAFFCECCNSPIPEARRKALDGVTLCVSCKEYDELKSCHNK
ncbi:TraR/DksA family transcriptional regulator [Erwinia rhapontici]|jgi:phage/conjugal plasmid C-4 type zinc finger TraR family protein|uniref:TraR/DksA family transcriptional regulator n=1 Tax=Erwinia rhapontici TaxID=55212 RepID=UPI0013317143|nr:TraR/DksA family transcriptional regulator [Erwinia rhapontici]MBP2156199.1 phage/conjugal plasmid C-4 type zinc finger TraR family protein [Erwinia rhapontici]